MLADLYNATGRGDKAMGTSCVGSSEAFMLAGTVLILLHFSPFILCPSFLTLHSGLALKFRWRKMRKDKGLPYDKPNIVFGANAQVLHSSLLLFLFIRINARHFRSVSRSLHFTST